MEKASLLAMMAALALLAGATGCTSGPGSWWSAKKPLPPVVASGGDNSYEQNLQATGPAGQESPGKLASWSKKVKSAFKFSSDRKDTASTKGKDPLDLSNKPKQPASLFVAFAHMHERSGNTSAAVEQYERALEKEPNHPEALLGYARLQDRQSEFAQATQLYEKAIAAAPGNAAIHNDLGLCHARQGRLNEAAASLEKAAQLAPDRKLYRNNLSTVLVELGRPGDALKHLSEVHPSAVSNYNVGYLLVQRQQHAAARPYFERAATLDPQMKEAQQWLQIIDAQR